MSAVITYVTLTDERYFLGAVALINSLRLTGNHGDVVVVDAGLTPQQVRFLAAACDVRRFDTTKRGVLPAFLKPAALEFAVAGGAGPTVVFIDSDIIVTADMAPFVAGAAEGRICLLPDGPPRLQGRRFEEWRGLLGIEEELRTQPYINSGFAALRPDLWSRELERWRDLCERVAAERSRRPHALKVDVAETEPFAYLDQDVLNALLMSEVAADRVEIHDWWRAGLTEPDDTTRLVDRVRLQCVNAHGPTLLVHHLAHPKPWLPEARGQSRYAPYDELLARLLDASDLPLRLPRDQVPSWTRDGQVHRLARRALRRSTRPVQTFGRLLQGR